MSSDTRTVKEPLEKNVKADCISCEEKGSDFIYIGFNRAMITNTPEINEFLLAKYGEKALFLYNCVNCNSAFTLAALTPIKPYPVS
ncbi:MAG: hypothetical protein AABW58_02915 [Nanoarchaeota archaeon]